MHSGDCCIACCTEVHVYLPVLCSIEHKPAEKTLFVYGYSMGFGLADHSVSVEVLKAKYPDYTSITFSNDGY